MKILLINTPSQAQAVVRDMAGGLGFDGGEGVVLPPLDLAYMAATLLNKGHSVKIIDSDVESYLAEDVYSKIKEFQPQVLVATVSLPTFKNDCIFIKQCRNYSLAKIIAKTAISYPQILKELLQESCAELCIYGESDINIDRIILGEDKNGTAYLLNSQLKLEENKLIDNLDRLPLPARNLLPNDKYHYCLLGDGKATSMQTSRGCPYPCFFYCPYPLVQGKVWRPRSPEHIVKELEDIVNNYDIHNILFRDATFTLDKNRVKKICGFIIEKKLKINWWCETRIDCLDQEVMQVMKKAGCLGMNVGIETGDPVLIQTQAKVGLTLNKLKIVRNTAKKLGIKLHFLFLIGLPDETKKTLYKTFKLIRSLKPESMGVCIITPYPGTPLYNQAQEKGLIRVKDWSFFGGHYPVMDTQHLTADDMIKASAMLKDGFVLLAKGLSGWLRLKVLDYRFKKWAAG